MKRGKTLAWLAVSVSSVLLIGGPGCRVRLDEKGIPAKAREIHGRILTVDTHCDSALNLLRTDWKIGDRHEPGPRASGKIDLPRMAEGGLDAEFFAAFVGQGPRTADGYAKARERALAAIEAIHKMTLDYPQLVGLAVTPADAYKLKKQRKLVAFIGLENGYPLGRDLSLIEEFHKKGVRYITLCHTQDNDICDSSTDRQNPQDNGLSDFGKSVVAECNRVGMMVDVSHASDKSFFDILGATKAPIIASHSSARAVCDNPRNLSDDMLRALAKNGGVVQICFLSSYVKKPPPNPQREKALKELEAKYGRLRDLADEALRRKAMVEYEAVNREFPEAKATVKDLVDHIDHVVRTIGVDSVGIGTDFDGGGGVSGCDDVSGMIHVTEELLRRGYSEKALEKIWGGNIMRVLQQVLTISAKLKKM